MKRVFQYIIISVFILLTLAHLASWATAKYINNTSFDHPPEHWEFLALKASVLTLPEIDDGRLMERHRKMSWWNISFELARQNHSRNLSRLSEKITHEMMVLRNKSRKYVKDISEQEKAAISTQMLVYYNRLSAVGTPTAAITPFVEGMHGLVLKNGTKDDISTWLLERYTFFGLQKDIKKQVSAAQVYKSTANYSGTNEFHLKLVDSLIECIAYGTPNRLLEADVTKEYNARKIEIERYLSRDLNSAFLLSATQPQNACRPTLTKIAG